MASDLPPSYEAVIAGIRASIPPDATGADVINAVDALPEKHLFVLTDNVKRTTAAYSANDTAKIENSFEFHIASAGDDMTAPGATSAAAVSKISTLFTNMKAELAIVDAQNIPTSKGKFVPQLQEHHDAFTKVINDSSTLATKIAGSATTFANAILPMIADNKLPSPVKLTSLRNFRDQGKTYENDVQNLSYRLEALKSDFGDFVKTFADWAKEKIAALKEKIEGLVEKLTGLEKTLRDLTISMAVFAGVTAISGGIFVGLIATGFPPAFIGAIIAAAVGAASAVALIALIAAVFKVRAIINQVKSELDDVRSTLGSIVDARIALLSLGNEALMTFNGSINVLGGVWTKIQQDIDKIDNALTGAIDPDKSLILTLFNKDLTAAQGFYTSLSTYLNAYADGVPVQPVPQPSS